MGLLDLFQCPLGCTAHLLCITDNQAFPSLKRTILLIPTVLAPLMAYLDSSSAFSCLALSIFPLTILLILPLSPSLVFVSADIVPLSTLLHHILARGLRSAGLILPLALLVFGIFAWSLNGDIFRGFDLDPQFLDSTKGSFSAARQGVLAGMPDEPPVEPGIAPFETRLWLFVTCSFLFLLSITLTLVRILAPTYPSTPPDPWAEEYGPAVAHAARERWAIAVRDGVVRKEIVPPLNWIADSIVPLDEVLFLYRFFPDRWRTERFERWAHRLERWRDTIWVFVMGPLCFPLYLIQICTGL
jgi:hypothetical protein